MICQVEGCARGGRLTKGMCNLHYQRLRLYGDLERGRKTAEERFWERVHQLPNGCWEWTGSVEKNGYGRLQHGGKKQPVRDLVHRFSYQLAVGLIPDGLTLDHLCHTSDKDCPGGPECRHRRCVNPSHLQPIPRGENTLRGKTTSAANAAKTHCINDHPFDAANTGHYRGARYCKRCKADAENERRRKRKALLSNG